MDTNTTFAQQIPPDGLFVCMGSATAWPAYQLAGGIEGGEAGVDVADDIACWRMQPPITLVERPDFGVTGETSSRWITRARSKTDHIARTGVWE